MSKDLNVTYGAGGWCENCDPKHKHPLNNIIEVIEVENEN